MLLNRELTYEEYNYYRKAYFNYGSEATITKMGNSAIKLFFENFGCNDYLLDMCEVIRENKFKKIKLLYDMKDYKNGLRPLETFSLNGKFVGYRVEYLDCLVLQFTVLSIEEKIFYLKQIKDILLFYHELGIIYGDIKDNNIFIDKKKKRIIFGDIDNMKIGKYDIDSMSSFASNFISKYGMVDNNLDSYMFNLMTMEQFMKCDNWYYSVLENLSFGKIPQELNNYKSRKLVKEILDVNRNYREEYFIDYV